MADCWCGDPSYINLWALIARPHLGIRASLSSRSLWPPTSGVKDTLTVRPPPAHRVGGCHRRSRKLKSFVLSSDCRNRTESFHSDMASGCVSSRGELREEVLTTLFSVGGVSLFQDMINVHLSS